MLQSRGNYRRESDKASFAAYQGDEKAGHARNPRPQGSDVHRKRWELRTVLGTPDASRRVKLLNPNKTSFRMDVVTLRKHDLERSDDLGHLHIGYLSARLMNRPRCPGIGSLIRLSATRKPEDYL